VERVFAVNPAPGLVRVQLSQGNGDVEGRFPLLRSVVDSPSDPEHVWVGPHSRRDLLQLRIRLSVIAQFQPALGLLRTWVILQGTMRTRLLSLSLIIYFAFALQVSAQAQNWQLVWADEFDGSSIDPSNWTYDIGGGGWGNRELEYYTSEPANSFIYHDASGNGYLVIQALQQQSRNRKYTSARLKTQGLRNWTYGRVEARIKVPNGQGVWPAFWMLGADFPTVGWPACGELDIMEHVLPIGANTVQASAHAPDYSGGNSVHCDATLADLSGEFHVFALEWEPSEIRYYVDDLEYFSFTAQTVTCDTSQTPLPGAWIFDHPFFIILNVAIGGGWPGPPDATTVFPVQMLVDYVRVYRDPDLQLPPASVLKVSQLGMSTVSNGPSWQAVATVRVTDGIGTPLSGVTVAGAWSGLINVGATQQTTDANGVALLNSGRVRNAGTITFCVSNLTKAGYSYVAVQNCASISR
jgi:beta-glucanase (GH16 family)